MVFINTICVSILIAGLTLIQYIVETVNLVIFEMPGLDSREWRSLLVVV
ncbi:hypothetical protein ACP6PL_18685 [Dapis sp. BLCC M126]